MNGDRFAITPLGRTELQSHAPRPTLPMYVVYRNPSDFPGKFVVRRFSIGPLRSIDVDEDPLVVADDLESARNAVPRGCIRFDRCAGDDPVIFEVWL